MNRDLVANPRAARRLHGVAAEHDAAQYAIGVAQREVQVPLAGLARSEISPSSHRFP